MRLKFYLALFSLCWMWQAAAVANEWQDIVIGQKTMLYSEVLKSEREIQVYLPQSYHYNDYTKYPVMYLLDGDLFFQSFSGMVSRMSSDASSHIPEMIVIGIRSSDRVKDSSPTHSLIGYNGQEDPGLDVTGGADAFLQFISTELIPFIEQKYRTNGHRNLVGYSFTGLAVTHAMLTMPEQFNSYLIIDFSAWWDAEVMLKKAAEFVTKHELQQRKDVFIATVDRVPNTVYPEAYNATWRFIQWFEKNSPDLIDFAFKKYSHQEENHHSMPLIAFYDGLKYIFRGHYLDYDALYNQPEKVKKQFTMLSERLQVKINPREGLINFLGRQFLYAHPDQEKALFYLHYNAENFPQSARVWSSLGDAYAHFDETSQAVKYYNKSLSIQPDNDAVRKKLDGLNKSTNKNKQSGKKDG